MKRNWDLIRELLISVERMDEDPPVGYLSPRERFVNDWSYYDPTLLTQSNEMAFRERTLALQRDHIDEVNAHVRMLLDAGLTVCRKGLDKDSPVLSLKDMELTMQGYDLLAVMAYKDTWERIKRDLGERRLPLTVFSILEISKRIVLDALRE